MNMKTNAKYKKLTQSQLSLWTGQKLHPEIPLYNMAHSFSILGILEEKSFQIAFNGLIKKSDALRTVFIEIDGLPYQTVIPDLAFQLEILDFSQYNENALRDWMENRSQMHFDLTKRLFDSVLIKVNTERYIWFLNIHHLVTDATSSTILYNILTKIYRDQFGNNQQGPVVVPLFNSYVAYESEQRANRNKGEIQTYWRTKISRLNAPAELYGKKNSGQATQTKRISLRLGNERSQKLRNLAHKSEIRSWTQDLTLFNLFATTLFTYLFRVSGQNSLVIGAPSHNRPTKSFKQTPGLFIEIYPLVTEIRDLESFYDVLEKVKIETNNYLRYAQPGMSTVAISKSFNVVLNYINAFFTDFQGFKMNSNWIHPGHCDPAHKMRCHVYDMDGSGEIEVYFDLNTEVFHKSLIDKVPRHFLKLLDALISDIHQPIGKPSLIEPIHSDKLFIEPGKASNNFLPIIQQFEQQVNNAPQTIALRAENRLVTYAQLDEKINQLAVYLNTQGIYPGTRVALYLERSMEYIIAVMATLKLGATFIPIASDQPRLRVSYILEDSDANLVLTNDRLKQNIHDQTVNMIILDSDSKIFSNKETEFSYTSGTKNNIAYIIYTSGSTGKPKGVMIAKNGIYNYLNWAKNYYAIEDKFIFPFFTSIGFDLTITSTFLPLITGGELIIYKEAEQGPDISLMEVIDDIRINSIKLTPSHLALIQGNNMSHSKIKTMIVGGEDFKTQLAKTIQKSFSKGLQIYNEYGPTEATVGCIVSKFNAHEQINMSVPIGEPIGNMKAFVLDSHMNSVPEGITGELYLSGVGLATGYLKLPNLTKEKFVEKVIDPNTKMYRTGDLAEVNEQGNLHYLGRIDEQVKFRGYRLELADIEANLLKHPAIENTVVVVVENEKAIADNEVINCSECGLPSNYPNTDFDEYGVCHLCSTFKGYRDKAQRYFKTTNELRNILTSKQGKNPHYDCISLLSGGKDSTYVLAQLVNMGLKVLAFTLDNGYISDQAKRNIETIVKKLKVDHIYGETRYMNKIFVDSLHRHQNVCNGCFKTIYTISTQIALEKEIPFIVTGLSRGQFFETRLTEELFWDENMEPSSIDEIILEARKLYHQEEDAVKSLMDVSMFTKATTFEKVQFIDFYRYSDVSLEEMLKFLKEKVDWVRPTDTGRSTNCLINQVGIYVHKKEKGYSNYSFPYSWDVRLGHKTREETLEEINEVINEKEVQRIIQEIGYQESGKSALDQKHLVGYYTAEQKVRSQDLANHLKSELPEYMVPSHFKFIKNLPLTTNGKVDKSVLKTLNTTQLEMEVPFVEPQGEIEELLANIWKEVLQLKQIGVHDNFITLGGHSLAAIRLTSRINEEIEFKFPLNKVFEHPTILEYAKYIECTLTELLKE
jgi:amino acid adenylation domain-containing protein